MIGNYEVELNSLRRQLAESLELVKEEKIKRVQVEENVKKLLLKTVKDAEIATTALSFDFCGQPFSIDFNSDYNLNTDYEPNNQRENIKVSSNNATNSGIHYLPASQFKSSPFVPTNKSATDFLNKPIQTVNESTSKVKLSTSAVMTKRGGGMRTTTTR